MSPRTRSALLASALPAIATLATLLFAGGDARATVTVTGPGTNAAPVFFGLAIPPIGGAADERGWAGFEFLMSGLAPGAFNSNDMYLIQGNDTNATQAIGIDLGQRDAIHAVPFDFSIEHNLVGGRNLTFSLTNTLNQQTSVLCWGLNCAAGSVSRETINGEGPFDAFNGIMVQIRSQTVTGSSATVRITELAGIDSIVGDPFFDGVVTPSSPGTVSPFDFGRQGQFFIADSLEFLTREWALRGVVTLQRPDLATSNRTQVRLAIDLVRDPTRPYVVPEPSTALLMALGLASLAAGRRTGV